VPQTASLTLIVKIKKSCEFRFGEMVFWHPSFDLEEIARVIINRYVSGGSVPHLRVGLGFVVG
jgi:hypothetical protein